MANGDVKLLGTWASPFALRVKVALKLKSVDYEYLEENLRGGKSELLLKSNPVHKKIPVLLHGDRPVCESLIIVQYIDEVWTYGPSILPSDPYARAIARFWAAYVEDKVWPSLRAVMTANDEEASGEAVAKFKEVLVLLEDAFVKSSKGKRFFGGDEIGYVDIAFGAFTGWFKMTEKAFNVELFDESTTPNLIAWVEAPTQPSRISRPPQISSRSLLKTSFLQGGRLLQLVSKELNHILLVINRVYESL